MCFTSIPPSVCYIHLHVHCASHFGTDALCTPPSVLFRQFDLALLDRRRGRSVRPLEQDPWLTESGMVQAHDALRHAQEEERVLLTSSHQQLQDLEQRRVDLIKKVVNAFLTSYR